MFEEIRSKVIFIAQQMLDTKLTDGTVGNFSVIDRQAGTVAITPSGVHYNNLKTEDIPVVKIDGEVVAGRLKPSSELLMHLAIYAAREDIKVVLHTHSRYAVAVSCTHVDLPAITVDMAAYCGKSVRCTEYHTPGSQKLADEVAARFSENTFAVLLANHGAVVVAPSVDIGVEAAHALELNAMAFIRSSVITKPVPISDENVETLMNLVYGDERRSV